MPESSQADARRHTGPEVQELMQQQMHTICTAQMVVGAAACLSTFPGSSFRGEVFLMYLSILVEGWLGRYFSRRHPGVAQLALLLGPTLSFTVALKVIGGPIVPYLAVVFVVASSATSAVMGFAAALLISVPLLAMLRLNPAASSALALLWLTAVVCLISSQRLFSAVESASETQQRASALLAEARARKGELGQVIRAADEANARLAVANERLTEARRQADEARQTKARFASNISHELRTPLNVIVGFTEAMYSSPQAYPGAVLSPRFLLHLQAVYHNARHVQKLIDDILDLAQLEAGKFALQPVRTDLVTVIHDAVEAIRELAAAHGLELITELSEQLPPVYVDRTRIKQVCLNLLSNAIRYTERGTVTVRATSDGREVFCSVADTGPGIPEAQQRRLFEEFEHVDPRPVSGRRGAGLGLAIGKHLVEQHGGRIWVESQPGVGSTFTFAIPACEEETLPTPAVLCARPVAPRPHSSRDTVLLVTPSMMAARLFSRHLVHYRCVSTTNSDEAVRQIGDLQPRGILVDAALGAEVAAKLHQAIQQLSIPNVPLIVSPMPGQAGLALAPQVSSYLCKPVSRQDLLDVLRTVGSEIETILAVDDDDDMLRLLTHYLQDARARPYKVLTARDGREALQLLGKGRPDLILLDMAMPVMDGHQFLLKLQSNAALADVPVVVVSGYTPQAELPTVDGCLQVQMPKGMQVDQLVRCVDQLLTGLCGPAGEAA